MVPKITSNIIAVTLLLVLATLAQVVYMQIECVLDDLPDYQIYIDSLETHGVIVGLQEEVNINDLMNADAFFSGPWNSIWGPWSDCDFPFVETIIPPLIEFARTGGHIVYFHHAPHEQPVLDSLLGNSAWETTVEIMDDRLANSYSYEFPPLGNLMENVGWIFIDPAIPIKCGNNAYPLYFAYDDCRYPNAAIIYPFINDGNCESYMFLATGTGAWDYYRSSPEWLDYYGDGIQIGTNMLYTAVGVPGYALPPCAVPEPFEIEVDSVPECANAGDTITLTGRNLWQGSNENIGGDIEIYFYGSQDTVVIPFEYSDHRPDPHSLYNTWLKFVCPSLPEGEYDVELGHKAITFYAGRITVPCESPLYLCHRTPNPFTPNGDGIHDEVEFTFPGLGEVPGTIKIFTLDNLRVRTIEVPAGAGAKQSAIWDGRDDTGTPMREGIYLYTIRAEGRIKCNGTVTLAR